MFKVVSSDSYAHKKNFKRIFPNQRYADSAHSAESNEMSISTDQKNNCSKVAKFIEKLQIYIALKTHELKNYC